MATYKKRGFKKNSSSDKVGAFEKKSTTASVFKSLDQGSSRTQIWIQKNQNKIFGLFALVILIILGIFSYTTFVLEPKEIDAYNKMFYSQKKYDEAVLINSDSLFNIALSGDSSNMGMLDIIEEYSGSKAANLANYYSGMIYFKLGDFENSINYLNDFSSDDFLLSSLAFGSMGDSYSELNQFDKAYDYFVKASNLDNNFTSPIFLYKAGLLAMKLDKFEKAEEHFTKIKLLYSKSSEAKNIDAFISRAIASYR